MQELGFLRGHRIDHVTTRDRGRLHTHNESGGGVVCGVEECGDVFTLPYLTWKKTFPTLCMWSVTVFALVSSVTVRHHLPCVNPHTQK